MIGFTNYEMGLWLTWDDALDCHPCAWSAEKILDFDGDSQSEAVKLYARCFEQEAEGRQGMHMIGDSIFVMPSLWFADALARQGMNVWMYRFDRETDERRKAMHAADQTYLFNKLETHAGHHITGSASDENERKDRERLVHVMQDGVLAFVRYGNPNSHNNTAMPDWPFYNEQTHAVMSFDFSPSIIADPVKDRRIWWYENIYKPALKKKG
jgi:para-nitrobenzyl esterase